jgi:Tfp pilus assembly protein PilP
MESELSVVVQRRLVEYNPMTDRDVFLPPTEKEKIGFAEAPLPLFENLKLVGILKDRQWNRALLEDEAGFGYILTSGERIKNGYVIAIEDDQAIFHVEEYGGYQIMVLELNQEY